MNRADKLRMSRTVSGIITIIKIVAIIVALFGFLYIQNNYVINNKIIYESSNIPKTFVGYKIIHVSDMTNKSYNTYSLIDRQKPNLVVFTGNFTDKNGNFENALELVNKVAKKYTTVYVTGELDNADDIIAVLDNTNAVCIEDKQFNIDAPEVDFDTYISKYIEKRYLKEQNDENSTISKYLQYTKEALINDKDKVIEISGFGLMDDNTDIVDKTVNVVNIEIDNFKIVAMNQSKYFKDISVHNMDLVLSGDTFGTDRFNNGYKSGIYNLNGTTMNLSNGIGSNPEKPLRIMNFPSITTIVLSDGTINNFNPLEKLLSNFVFDVNTRFDNDGGFKEYTYKYGK